MFVNDCTVESEHYSSFYTAAQFENTFFRAMPMHGNGDWLVAAEHSAKGYGMGCVPTLSSVDVPRGILGADSVVGWVVGHWVLVALLWDPGAGLA